MDAGDCCHASVVICYSGLPELFRLDQRGRVTKVDAGAIAEGSLTLTPDTRRLYWTKDGVARTR
jgi:hypothetical protein